MIKTPVGRLLTLSAIALLSVWPSRWAHAEIPAEKQAVILTRALAYDNNLHARAGSGVVVGIVYRGGDSASEAMAEAMYRAFKALESVKLQDLPFRAIKLPFTGREALLSGVGAQHVSALYVCAGVEGELAGIKEVGRKAHALTLGAGKDLITKDVSVGLSLIDGKATITVNLPQSREEGAALSSELLRLARVQR